MNTRQDKYAEVQSKLREGLELLNRSSDGDNTNLSVALIKLHGALEDFLRFEIAKEAPHLRARVEDAKQSNWRDLISYARQYRILSEADAGIITRANGQRQEVAHGGNYSGSRDELLRYAEFVQRQVGPGESIQDLRSGGQPPPSVFASQEPATSSRDPRPWYRSTLFLLLVFAFLGIFFCAIGLVPYLGPFSDTLQELIERIEIPSIATGVAESTAAPAVDEVATVIATDAPFEPTSGSEAACTIVWVEYEADLGRKNRAMVWEQIVVFQVKGSGMTHREFFDLVVEHNPDLVADDYEFKAGKTYLLPECE